MNFVLQIKTKTQNEVEFNNSKLYGYIG